MKQLLNPEVKAKVLKEADDLENFIEKDKIDYINSLNVVVCNEKCPCCGRICGFEKNHRYHQCLFGHQMRGFNGNYIEMENGVKEASVIRCEQMA